MGSVMDSKERADSHSKPTTLDIADSESQIPATGQSQGQGKSSTELPIYLVSKDRRLIQPLNVPARNAIAHRNPALLKHALAEAHQRQANKEGLFKDAGCVVRWKPSRIPFHIDFEISTSGNTCQHLAFVKNITAKDPDQYARKLVPLAKLFLSKPPESHLPHLPFTQPQILSNNLSDRTANDKRTIETIQHARAINKEYNSLKEIDMGTAETTARMMNAGKIFHGLLVYLTSPQPHVETAVNSTESPKTEPTGSQSPETPLSAVSKTPKPRLSVHESQSLGSELKPERKVSNLGNDTDGAKDIAEPIHEESSAPEEMSAVRNSLSDESPTATKSLKGRKGRKASKNNDQGRKQALKRLAEDKFTSTVSAYPTQRPPRKKAVKKSSITRESLQETRLNPEAHSPEQMPATQTPCRDPDCDARPDNELELCLLPKDPLQKDREPSFEEQENFIAPVVGETHNDHEENNLESLSHPVELSQIDWDSSSEEQEESRADIAEEVSDLELSASDVTITLSEFVRCRILNPTASSVRRGARGLLWAYKISKKVNSFLVKAGAYLWRKPNTYFQSQPLLRTEYCGHSVLAPVIISRERASSVEPIIEFDGKTVHIVPHEQYWEDVRSQVWHTDFLVPWKLVEYQACEAAGYQVWRHDRDLLKCRKPGCNVMVSDHHHSTIVCLGCGPKSVVRYCSLWHQLEDIEGHWRVCSTWKVLLKRVIDHGTAPRKFARMFPAIKERNGSRAAALYRQKLYCALTYGHYTLFDPSSTRSETLCWSKQDPNWPEMDRRIERLLNIAFLDSWNHYILGYLYRLLRELLRSLDQWSENTERLLKCQFESEFRDYKVNTNWRDGEDPCQCEWSGKIIPQWDHSSTCRTYAPGADNRNPVWRKRCIQATVENYENRFWILRAWRQQHPTQNNWRLRAAGHGFPGMVPDEGCYKLGPGWTGWGGAKDNICGDKGDPKGAA